MEGARKEGRKEDIREKSRKQAKAVNKREGTEKVDEQVR